MLVQMWDPTNNILTPQLIDGKDEEMVPHFTEPKIIFCTLPGGYNFFNICEPGIVKPMESAMADPAFVFVFLIPSF